MRQELEGERREREKERGNGGREVRGESERGLREE